VIWTLLTALSGLMMCGRVFGQETCVQSMHQALEEVSVVSQAFLECLVLVRLRMQILDSLQVCQHLSLHQPYES